MPFAPRVLEITDELLPLGVDADRGLAGRDRRVYVVKLRITVGVLRALQRLAR